MMTNRKRYTILATMFTSMGVMILIKSLMNYQNTVSEVMLGFVAVIIGMYYFYERGIHDIE